MSELKEVKEIPRYKHLYILEVQQYEESGGFTHVGYMNRLFGTEKDAALYYQKYNPNLRSINARGNNASDWHPQTMLRHRIHIYAHEKLTIEPWDGVISDKIWLPKPYTKLGKKAKLGLPMAKGPGEPMAEFPMCIGEECWCYDCAMDTTRPDNFDEDDYDEDEHVLMALRKAKELRKEYTEKLYA